MLILLLIGDLVVYIMDSFEFVVELVVVNLVFEYCMIEGVGYFLYCD